MKKFYLLILILFLNYCNAETISTVVKTASNAASKTSAGNANTIIGNGKAPLAASPLATKSNCTSAAELDAKSKLLKPNPDGTFSGKAKTVLKECKDTSPDFTTCECTFTY